MSRCFVSVAALCALLVASTALAQPGGRGNRGGFGGPGGGMSSSMLLGIPEVQKELGISDDQKTKIQTASTEMQTERRSAFQNMRNMSQDERTKAFADMTKKSEEKFATILTGDQTTRLKQLQLQIQGANALVSTDVVAKLSIKDDQKTKIQKVIDDARAARGNRGGGPGGGTAGGTSRAEQRAKTLKDALAVLDDDQLVQWGQMTGKAFKFPDNMGFGNRGNNRGGNRGGGRGGNGGGAGGGAGGTPGTGG